MAYTENLQNPISMLKALNRFDLSFMPGDVFYPGLNKIFAIGWQIPAVLIHDNRFLLVEGLN